MIIENGKGDGTKAEVNSQNRLEVQSTTTSQLSEAVKREATWNVGTGPITLTTATASAIFYMKNTGAKDLEIDLYVILARASTGGSGLALVEILLNPTGGTIVSGATAVDTIAQMNTGSSNTPSANIYKGAQGNTLTGQTSILRSQNNSVPDRLLLPITTIVHQGGSVGIRYTPPSGNTSQIVEAVVEMFEAP